MSLADNPEIAANIRSLAEATGIPVQDFVTWLECPAPDGIDPTDWYESGLADARTGKPMPRSAIEELRGLIARSRSADAKRAA